MHELLVDHDIGVPLMMKSFDGNESNNKIFKERAKGLVENFKKNNEKRTSGFR